MRYPKIKYGRGRTPEAMNLQLGYFFSNDTLMWVSELWNYFKLQFIPGSNYKPKPGSSSSCQTDLRTIQFFTLDMVWSQK